MMVSSNISIVVGDYWPRIVITILNSSEPSVLYQEACCCMKLLYQVLHTQEVVGTENLQGRPFRVSR